MPAYVFRCPDPDCCSTTEVPNPRTAVWCASGTHDQPRLMQRVYIAPSLTSSAVPTRYPRSHR